MKKITYDQLISFTHELLGRVGLDAYSNNAVTTGLCETSLRGVDSHGIRLLPHYVASALSGRKNPQPNMSYTQVFPAFGKLDADNAFGHAAGMKAIDEAMKVASIQGMAAICVQNSSHPGAMASFALKAARKGFIAFAFTHADALMATHNGTRPFFGTNPICMAVPREGLEPYCLDMATSVISWNKVLAHKASGEKLEAEYAIDENGQSTNDPKEAIGLKPIGEYKGYGLSSMIDILCGVLTGMPFGRDIPSMYKHDMDKPRHLGQFYMVFRPDVCMDKETFLVRMQQLSQEIYKEPTQSGEKVILPGDKETACAKERKQYGIPITDQLYQEFCLLAKKHSLEALIC